MAEPDFVWFADQTDRIIIAAIDRDFDTVTDVFADVAQRYGESGVFAVCCGIAEAVIHFGGYRHPGDHGGFYGLVVEHPTRGVVAPEELGEAGREVLAASRFVVAALNGDTEQQLALYATGSTLEDFLTLPTGLVWMLSALGRRKIEEATP